MVIFAAHSPRGVIQGLLYGHLRQVGSRLSPKGAPASCDDQLIDLIGTIALETLKYGAVLTVDGGERDGVLLDERHHQFPSCDQDLFTRQSDILARFNCGDGWQQPDHAGNADDHDIHFGKSCQVNNGIHSGWNSRAGYRFVQRQMAHPESVRLLAEQLRVRVGGKCDDLEIFRMFGDYVQSLRADTASRAKDGDAFHLVDSLAPTLMARYP